jgi:hypothetical protein
MVLAQHFNMVNGTTKPNTYQKKCNKHDMNTTSCFWLANHHGGLLFFVSHLFSFMGMVEKNKWLNLDSFAGSYIEHHLRWSRFNNLSQLRQISWQRNSHCPIQIKFFLSFITWRKMMSTQSSRVVHPCKSTTTYIISLGKTISD